MTGPSVADRRAAACALAELLTADGRRAEIIDRPLATESAGSAPGEALERTGLLAEVLARNGIVAIAPCAADGPPAPVRARHEASGTRYIEVPVFAGAHPSDIADTAYGLLVRRGERAPVPGRGREQRVGSGA
ncbi:hypothetical protein ACFXAZ_23705 [Streptomyces sp. NPDC059477]|uniref:hypothetical protein n=1 Tax=Streptomyces sp. NPDC059477 TaxID=3346847 RepID=UPI00369877D6